MKNISVYIPNAISTRIGRATLLGRKNSPTILFAAGVVGFVATTVVASRATLKLDEILNDTEDHLETAKMLSEKKRPDYTETDYNRDKLYIYARATVEVTKLYAPAFMLGAASIACLTKSHNILTNRNASLMAAYAALDAGFTEYRRRVVDTLGEDADRNFRYAEEKFSEPQKDDEKEEDTPVRVAPSFKHSIYARYFDESCPSWSPTPNYNKIFLKGQQNYANDLLVSRGHVFLNEIYDLLGFDRTREGSVVGWTISKNGGDNYIDFGIFDDNGAARDFVNGREGSILLDFNVDGIIYDKI